MKNRVRRIWSVLCMTALLVSGCGSAGETKGEQPGGSGLFAASGAEAMGRYVETQYELPQDIDRNGGIN